MFRLEKLVLLRPLLLFFLLTMSSCGTESEHWVVVNILNQSRELEQIPETADVCNCVSPEQKTTSCSAGTTGDVTAELGAGLGASINWATMEIDPSVASSIGIGRQNGESLQLSAPPSGICRHYDLATQYEIVKGQALVRTTDGNRELEPSFSFHATCKIAIVAMKESTCDSVTRIPLLPVTPSRNIPNTLTPRNLPPTRAGESAILTPDEFIRYYYAEISNHNYHQTWQLLSNHFKQVHHCCNADGSYQYEPYANYWDTFSNVQVTDTSTLEQNASAATIVTKIHYLRSDGRDGETSITFDLIFEDSGWQIDEQR